MLWLDMYVRLREESILWIFVNRVLSKVFESWWEEVRRGLRQLQREEHHDFYCSPDFTG